MRDISTDVLICGAGAAGLALGIELARRGVAFQIVEKTAVPFAGSRGKGIQPRTLEVFEDMRLVDRVAAIGGFYPLVRTHAADGFKDEPAMAAELPTPAEPYTRPLMLPQFLTEGLMRDRLAELGHRVSFGSELTAFKETKDGVTATVGGGKIHARYLIGADGGRSFVRRTLDIGFPGQTLAMRAVVADLSLAGLDRHFWHRWGDNLGNQIALCPLSGTDLFQLQAPIPLEGDVDLSAKGLGAMIAERTKRKDITVHSVAWASAYNLNARLADRYRVGRVFLVGDAAHIHPPTGGQGLNTSIGDAYNIGWKLAAVLNGAPPGLLDTYEAERRPIAEEVLGLSTKLLEAARQRHDMQRGRENHQLDLGYPDSALSLVLPSDLRRRACVVCSGDRAPDAPCRGAGGQRTRLFNLFRGTHWTLLINGAANETVTPRAKLRIHVIGKDILDDGGHIRDAYALAPGACVLIRPDGYVSAVVPNELPALEKHLAGVGLAKPA
jgi:2-polyprenyl-6-methoxyphenol hydroxylase-like FAD-dependent oxidoreductase